MSVQSLTEMHMREKVPPVIRKIKITVTIKNSDTWAGKKQALFFFFYQRLTKAYQYVKDTIDFSSKLQK